MKKAILINVESQSFEIILIEDGLNPIYNAIGNGCDTFACPIIFDNEDTIYSDDEILLRVGDIKGGFLMRDWIAPIVNNAIVLGTDEDGESVDCKTTIEYLERNTIFFDAPFCKEYAIEVMNQPPRIYTL